MTNGVFVSRPNPVTGQLEWVVMSEDYDYQQEISCSSYADMLHDKGRNKAYYHGLKVAIASLRAQGQMVRVLDIGTGSGLLSMMAARLGADEITACEAFEPVAQCAHKVIQANGFQDRIKLVHKRSTELKIGVDIVEKVNLLVAEVFDTDLIGEAALHTFTHALDNLVTPDCLVVPARARLYCQVFHSKFLESHHFVSEDSVIPFPPSAKGFPGLAASLDVQVSQLLPETDFIPLSEPVLVKTFNFTPNGETQNGRQSLKLKDSFSIPISLSVRPSSGKVSASGVFLWWDLLMHPFVDASEQSKDPLDILSCCPSWHNAEQFQWREHWMQAIHFFHQPLLSITQDCQALLHYAHDEFSNHFDLREIIEDSNKENKLLTHIPYCSCGFHTAYSRSRLAEIQNLDVQNCLKMFVRNLSAYIDGTSTDVVVISDGSSLPFLFRHHSQACNSTIYAVEENTASFRCMSDLLEEISVKAIKDVGQFPSDTCSELLIVAEPYFLASVLPWHDLHFWYAARALSKSHGLAGVFPGFMRIYIMLYNFNDLGKVRSVVGSCEGFDLTCFDELVENGAKQSREPVEPYHLWEYPGSPLSDPKILLEMSFSDFSRTLDSSDSLSTLSTNFSMHCSSMRSPNACVLWCEWFFNETAEHLVASTGPQASSEFSIGKTFTQWNRYRRQAVHFLPTSKNAPSSLVSIDATLHLDTCRLSLFVHL